MFRNTLIVKSITLVLIFLCSFTNLIAATDQFNINLSVTAGADTIAPSIPSALSATAVSASQIDLSWSASSDNIGVTGYRIYRDSSLVGTVVSTNYSDTGLSASTFYTYTVSAIDAALNESAQSASSSATTLAAPVSTSSGNGGGRSQTSVPQIYNLQVRPSVGGAVVTWNTSVPTQSTFSFGLTSNLEKGSVAETFFTTDHSVTLPNLLSGTNYQFLIQVVSGYGGYNELRSQLTTLGIPEGNVNARNFTATAGNDRILLKWRNPTGNFAEERIVRSTSFYPADPSDGEVVYEGRDEVSEDINVTVGTRYYYTLFTKDADGNYSSGLLATARIQIAGEPEGTNPDTLGNLPEAPNVDPIIQALTFLDFDFIQNGKKINGDGSNSGVVIDGTQNLTVSLDYKKVPEVLKSIAITLQHPTDPAKTFSFLLRINKEKTAYTATIGALGDSGTYGVHIAIVDYKNRGLKNIFGNLLASAGEAIDTNNRFFFLLLRSIENNLFTIVLILILIIALSSVIKRKFESRNKK